MFELNSRITPKYLSFDFAPFCFQDFFYYLKIMILQTNKDVKGMNFLNLNLLLKCKIHKINKFYIRNLILLQRFI